MKKLPKAGELRERIVIRKRDNTPNSRGQITTAFRDVVSVWAKVDPIMPVPQVAGAVSDLDDSSHKAMFYSPNIGIDTNMRATWRGQDYAVKKSVSDPVNRFTTIYLKGLDEAD